MAFSGLAKALVLCAFISSHLSLVSSNPVTASKAEPTPTGAEPNSTAKSNDTCINQKKFLFPLHKDGRGIILGRLNDTLPCVLAIPAPPKELREYNLKQLYSFLDNFYGWANIVENSTDTPGFLSEVDVRNSTWTVHNSTVNWKEGLGKINETEWKSGFEYHHAIAKLFASFNDAHTIYYIPPLSFPLVLPFRINSKVVNGEQVLMLNSNLLTKSFDDYGADFQKLVPEEHFKKPIESVNGQDPIEFFQTYFADPLGSERSAGARLNNFLTTSITWGLPLMNTGIFNFTDLTFNFGNGSTLTTDIFVMLPKEEKSVAQYYDEMSDPTQQAASFYHFVLGWMNVTDNIPDNKTTTGETILGADRETPLKKPKNSTEVAPAGRSLSTPSNGSSHLDPFFEDLEKDTKAFLEKFQNGTRGPFDNVTAIVFPEGGKNAEQPVAAVFNYSGVPVLKFQSFMLPEDEQADAVMSTIHALGNSFKDSDRLVIDVVGNGGGVVQLMYGMLAALVPGFKNHTELCQSFQLPMSKFGQEWIDSFQKLHLTANYKNEIEVKEYISDVEAAIMYIATIDPDFGSEILKRHNMTFRDRNKPSFENMTLAEQNKLITEFRKVIEVLASNPDVTSIGYAPFSADGGTDPLTGKPLKPDFFNTTVEVEWGGNKSYFSRRFISNDCMAVKIDEVRKAYPKSFKELVVLTDGTCGSACSAFTTQLLASGFGTVVSVGGRMGEPLDIGSFNGGYVDKWDVVFQEYFTNLALASILEDSSRIKISEDLLPLPLLDAGAFTLNFGIGSSNLLPSNALPVEWYTKPANVHLNVWPSYMALDYSMWSKLAPEQYKEWDQIYAHLAASSKKDLGKFQNNE